MAYTNPLDPTRPTDADLVSSGDNEFRTLKAAIIERLATIIDGLPDTDPLTIRLAALAGVYPQVGENVARPATAAFAGQLWYSVDVQELYIGLASLVWERVLVTGSTVPKIVAAGSPGQGQVLLIGNENVRSYKLEQEGGAWTATQDGSGGIRAVPVPAGATWTVKATVFGESSGDVTSDTQIDTQSVQVLGAGSSAPAQYVILGVSQPTINSSVLTYTIDGEGTLTGMHVLVYYSFDDGSGWSVPELIRTIDPVPGSSTPYTQETGFVRKASGRDFSAKVSVELRSVSTGAMIYSDAQSRGWYVSDLL